MPEELPASLDQILKKTVRGDRPPTFLFVGPMGTGKTSMVKEVAASLQLASHSLSVSDLLRGSGPILFPSRDFVFCYDEVDALSLLKCARENLLDGLVHSLNSMRGGDVPNVKIIILSATHADVVSPSIMVHVDFVVPFSVPIPISNMG